LDPEINETFCSSHDSYGFRVWFYLNFNYSSIQLLISVSLCNRFWLIQQLITLKSLTLESLWPHHLKYSSAYKLKSLKLSLIFKTSTWYYHIHNHDSYSCGLDIHTLIFSRKNGIATTVMNSNWNPSRNTLGEIALVNALASWFPTIAVALESTCLVCAIITNANFLNFFPNSHITPLIII